MIAEFSYEKKYWPECGTDVPAIPQDLNTLWDTNPDQAAVFIAENVIEEKNHIMMNFRDDQLSVFAPVWQLGGDIIGLEFSLLDLIKDEFAEICDQSVEGYRDRITNMREIARLINSAADNVEDRLSQYKTTQPLI